MSSAIMSPLNKQVVVHSGEIRLNGWAYSGGGKFMVPLVEITSLI